MGAGTDVDGLMQAFVNSAPHYRNIVDPDYNYIGVGVVWGADGRLYTCHVFMGMGAVAAPEPEPEPDPVEVATVASGTGGASSGRAPRSVVDEAPAPAAPPPPPQGPPPHRRRVATVLVALRSLSG